MPIKDSKLLSQIYRALIITYQSIMQYIDPVRERREEETLKLKIKTTIGNWATELPEDDYMISEKRRLKVKYPKLIL